MEFCVRSSLTPSTGRIGRQRAFIRRIIRSITGNRRLLSPISVAWWTSRWVEYLARWSKCFVFCNNRTWKSGDPNFCNRNLESAAAHSRSDGWKQQEYLLSLQKNVHHSPLPSTVPSHASFPRCYVMCVYRVYLWLPLMTKQWFSQAVSASRQQGTNLCDATTGYGGCTHLCLMRGAREYHCACPDPVDSPPTTSSAHLEPQAPTSGHLSALDRNCSLYPVPPSSVTWSVRSTSVVTSSGMLASSHTEPYCKLKLIFRNVYIVVSMNHKEKLWVLY